MFRWAVIAFPVVCGIWVPLGSVGQFNFTLADAFLVVIVTDALVFRHSSIPRLAVRILLPVVVLEALTVATGAFHFGMQQGLADGLVQAKRFVEYSLIVIPASHLRSHERRYTLLFLMAFAVILTGVALTQINSNQGRSTSLLFYENNYGLYCALLFAIAVSVLLFDRSLWPLGKGLAMIAVGASTMGALLSGSRAASIGLIAAALVMVAILPRSRRGLRVFLVGVAIAVFVVAGSVAGIEWPRGNLLARWAEVLDHGGHTLQVKSRWDAASYSWAALKDQGVVVGLGISGVPFYTAKHVKNANDWRIGRDVRNAGNQFMQLLAELGLIGVVPFLVLMYRMAILCRSGRSGPTSVSASLLMSLAVLVFAGTGMHTFYVPQVMAVIWILVGFRIGERTCSNGSRPFLRYLHVRWRCTSRGGTDCAGIVSRGH